MFCLGLAQPSENLTAAPKVISDKTMVAWVYPANLEQRGGSALTLFDQAEHFDAIVLGEKAPGKWMAGSDFFRRTQDAQGPYARETADARPWSDAGHVSCDAG